MKPAAKALLKLNSISKSFGGVRALDGVSLELKAGEVHALVGENGAGKSTLIKIITGAVKPDAGSIAILGRTVERNDPATARQLGISVIYQQPALFPDLTVAENLSLRLEPSGGFRLINWKKRRENASRLLERIGAEISPDVLVSDLKMPQQQLVEIASAIGGNAKLLILDEPTSSLTEREVDNLLRIVRQLREAGVGMIYISHRMDELAKIADRVTVLRDGKLVGTCAVGDVTTGELIRMMVGRELSSVFPKIQVELGESVLRLADLGCSESGIDGINLAVRAGEILGLAGLVGAGRSELARVLFGLTPADTGQIFLRGKAVRINSPSNGVRLGIAYVPEDRRRHGVILEMPVTSNTTLAILRRISRVGLLDFAMEREIAGAFVNRLGTKAPSLDAPLGQLSGGNQQKVALARWLATEPAVMILDEPTQGVDVGAKAEIHRLMCELAARGLALIMISSELPEILGMSDRIAVMQGGRVVGVLNRADATQEKVLKLALGNRNLEALA